MCILSVFIIEAKDRLINKYSLRTSNYIDTLPGLGILEYINKEKSLFSYYRLSGRDT